MQCVDLCEMWLIYKKWLKSIKKVFRNIEVTLDKIGVSLELDELSLNIVNPLSNFLFKLQDPDEGLVDVFLWKFFCHKL